MAATLINASTLKKLDIAVSTFSQLGTILQKNEVWKIEVTSPNYKKKTISILGPLFKYENEQGERRTFLIEGKPGLLKLFVNNLAEQGASISASCFNGSTTSSLTYGKRCPKCNQTLGEGVTRCWTPGCNYELN